MMNNTLHNDPDFAKVAKVISAMELSSRYYQNEDLDRALKIYNNVSAIQSYAPYLITKQKYILINFLFL